MDDKTAVSINSLEKKKNSFSFFGGSVSNISGKLRYMTNTVDESAIEDNPFFCGRKNKTRENPCSCYEEEG